MLKALVENGFLVEDPEDEAEWLQYEFQKHKHNSRCFELTITPTLDCNFRCPYCYEKKRPGVMSLDVQDAVVRFVEEGFEDKPFRQLRIVWYGGEPLKEPEVIERLSERFISFCKSKGIDYQAHLMTNGSMADEEMMRRMRQCAISSVQVCLGGYGTRHDLDRINLAGKSTYNDVFENACRMASEGFAVHVEFVVDHDNYESCLKASEAFAGRENIWFHMPYRKADYNGDLYRVGDDGEKRPLFDYLTPKEIDRFTFEYFMKLNPTAAQFRERFVPLHHFCGSSLDRFYVIDELGYAYKCICDVDKPQTHAIFNICDKKEDRSVNWHRLLHFANENPARTEPCRTCRLYPICNGYCYRTDEVGSGDFYRKGKECTCQTFKYTIEDFVREYHNALVREGGL